MREQNAVAREHDYSFLRTSGQVNRFVDLGLLVELPGNSNYELVRVSFPYARPAVKTFVERLAGQYRAACGEKLVVTSLTRPEARQPRNSSDLSVHPAGMAVDLRVSQRTACRKWLESTLLSLEKRDVVDVTRERHPPHYHVAVFPHPYQNYVAALQSRASTHLAVADARESKIAKSTAAESKTEVPASRPVQVVATSASTRAPVEASAEPAAVEQYEVRRGDTLWGIARKFGITVDALKEVNSLGTARIMAGQTLTVARADVPAPSAATEAAASMVAVASMPAESGPSEPTPAPSAPVRYEVRPGDTLWDIARSHGITVDQLKSVNGLSTARIKAGQTLALPSP